MRQTIRRTDSPVAAEITAVRGLLGLKGRRLVANLQAHFKKLAEYPTPACSGCDSGQAQTTPGG